MRSSKAKQIRKAAYKVAQQRGVLTSEPMINPDTGEIRYTGVRGVYKLFKKMYREKWRRQYHSL